MAIARNDYPTAKGFPPDVIWTDLLGTIIVDQLAGQDIIITGWYDRDNPTPSLPASTAWEDLPFSEC